MAAITRWVEYDVDANGYIGGAAQYHLGTRGACAALGTVDPDGITIGPTTSSLTVNIDGTETIYTGTITLYSGSNLDPRFIARDITEKLHAHGVASKASAPRWINATCKWENTYNDVPAGTGTTYPHCFKIYSGTLGVSSGVTVTSGSASSSLGFDTQAQPGGLAASGNYDIAVQATVSGTYQGFFDEIYKVVVSTQANRGIGTLTKHSPGGGTNTYNGIFSTGGVYNYATDCTYVISIDITNGSTMGGGTGNVPLMSWTSTGGLDDSDSDVELLYVDHWYPIGTRGLMVSFTDAVFSDADPAWTIVCAYHQYAEATNNTAALGTAYYVYASDRGDQSTSPVQTAAAGGYTLLGGRGLSISFAGGGEVLRARDEFYVICTGPQPLNYNITSLNYGNVTVGTESPVKSVIFEVESGAVEVSTVKFGLEDPGNFNYHNPPTGETKFRFGTNGPNNMSGSGDNNKIEWPTGVLPSYLSAGSANMAINEADLDQVSDADSSELVYSNGLISDPVWLCIKLGSSETGANSAINHRLYFDYS